jgi:hypothetical protein
VKVAIAFLFAIAAVVLPAHAQSYAVQEIRIDQPRVEQPRVEQPRVEQPRLGVPTIAQPVVVEPRLVMPKVEEIRADSPRQVLAQENNDSFWRYASRAVAVSDFKNGIYMLNGKRVTYSDLWQPTHGHGEVVPGVGWTYTKTEPWGGQYWVPATPVVNNALLRDNVGFTVVMDCSVSTPDVEGSATVGVMASVFDSNMDKFSIAGAFHDPPSWGGTGGTPPWISTTDGSGPTKQFITLGDMYRFAANLGPEEYLSLEGRPVRHQPATDWGNLNAFYLFATFESSWTVPQIVVVERIALYPLQKPDMLPVLASRDGVVPGVKVVPAAPGARSR